MITSQTSQWPSSQSLDVPMLDQDVAAAFLQDRMGSTDRDAARELADELGGLPLALEQAAPRPRGGSSGRLGMRS
jgi:hypothetical protein